MTVTVLGGRGFIGSHVVDLLRSRGEVVLAPAREEALPQTGVSLGTVLYCAGVTGDFLARPLETVDAHVSSLARLLRDHELDRLIYLSSARVYRGDRSDEQTPLEVRPQQPDHLYDLSKMLGEAVALTHENSVVVRLSHVYGGEPSTPNFLSDLVMQAIRQGVIRLRTSLESSRDYVEVGYVTRVLAWLIDSGTQGVLNIGSGRATRHREIVDQLRQLTETAVDVPEDAADLRQPPLDVSLLRSLYGNEESPDVLSHLSGMVSRARMMSS